MNTLTNTSEESAGSQDSLIAVHGTRKRVIPYVLGGGVCFAVAVYAALSSLQSVVAFSWAMAAGFSLFVYALHDATVKHTIRLTDGALVLEHRSVLWSTTQRFEGVNDIYLSKPVRGHGFQPVDVCEARQEYASSRTQPRVNGLYVSSGNRLRHVPLAIPFESLLSVAEALMQQGDQKETGTPIVRMWSRSGRRQGSLRRP